MMQVVIYRVCYQNHNDTVLHCMRVTSILSKLTCLTLKRSQKVKIAGVSSLLVDCMPRPWHPVTRASMSIKRMHTTRGRSFFQITHTTSQCDDPHPVHAPC